MPALPSTPPDSPASPPIDYRAIYHLLRERAWIIGAGVLAGLVASVFILVRSPNIYRAVTVLLVEQEEQKVVDIQRIQPEDYQSLEALKTVEQSLQNPALLERVIDANHLERNPDLFSSGRPLPRSQLVTKLARLIDVRLRRGTRLIDVAVEDTDPALTALVANSLVAEFLRQDFDQDAATLHSANDFLLTEAGEIKVKLDEAENALQAYKEKTQSVATTDTQNTVMQELDEMSVKATEAKSQRIAAETAYRQVQALGNNPDALLVTAAADQSVAIKQIRASIAQAESDFAELKLRYRAKHPKYIQMQSRLAQWKSALDQAVLELPQTALSSYQSAQAAEQALEAALAEQQSAAVEMNRRAIQFDALNREVESDRALYQTVLTRIKENTVIKDLKTSNLRVIEPAEIPERPIKPDKIEVSLAGLLCGLAGGVGVVFFLDRLDRSLKTVRQTEEALELPVICSIPVFKHLDPEDASAKTETFRTLRTNLALLGPERKVVLFTSSLPGEGKTFCSFNYAMSLAHQGLRTLLIDADLRRPMVEKILGFGDGKEIGLTDFLSGKVEFEQAVHSSAMECLAYVPGGTSTRNPVELLAKGGFDGLVREALAKFDRVVIDSAPIQVVSDTLLILSAVQTVCLVVGAGQTPREAAARTTQVLRSSGTPLAGIVLNMLSAGGSDRGFYYEYAYRGKYAETAA